MDLNIDKCINSTLLKLTCDGYLKIEDNTFVYTNKNLGNLSNSERNLILSIKKECEDSKDKFYERYRYSIIGELLKEGYIKQKKKPFFTLICKVFLFFLILFLIFIMIMCFILKEKIFDIIGFILIIFLFGGILIAIISEILITKKGVGFDFNYYKTEKSKEVIEKMLGLKAFLKDFSNIKNRTLDELGLQEYYFVCSIIFDLNDDENIKIDKIKNNSLYFNDK